MFNHTNIGTKCASKLECEMLTNEFLNYIWVFESLSHSVVQSQKSQHEEQSQTQLQGKGQHAQHDYGVVNC